MKEHEAGNTLSLEEFEQIIGYTFHDKQLLQEALSHSSYANEKKKLRRSNERLEFLGDSVLSIVVSQYLFKHFTHLPEGELTKIRASLVCEKSLHVFAQKIRLGDAILLGKGEENTGGRTVPPFWRMPLRRSLPPFSWMADWRRQLPMCWALSRRISTAAGQQPFQITRQCCRKSSSRIRRRRWSICWSSRPARITTRHSW